MAVERLTGVVKSFFAIGQSRVDRLVGDYRDLETVSRLPGSDVPFRPEDIADIARRKGKLTEEEISEYLSRTQNMDASPE